MLLFYVIEILYFTAVLSVEETTLAPDKQLYLQQEKGVSLKPDAQDIKELFKHDVKTSNDTKEVWDNNPIALEGGSSVVANDTRISENDSPKDLRENTTSDQTALNEGGTVTAYNSKYLEKSIQTEGGLIDVPASTSVEGSDIKIGTSSTTDFVKDSFQLQVEEDTEHSSVVSRKGVSSKIVPRKGAEPNELLTATTNNTEMKPPLCSCCQVNMTEQADVNYTLDAKCLLCCNTPDSEKSSTTIVALGNGSSDNDSYTADYRTERPLKLTNTSADEVDVYRASPPLKKKENKKKPLVTFGEDSEQNQQKFQQSLSNSEKNDFVIPVVFVILAVPLVVVLAMLFYKKGTEFWERRHYRRMDFLIDGMYND